MSEPLSAPPSATLSETAKHPLLSKTIWVQVLAVLAALVPAVRDWLAANPVEFVAVLAAVNVLVRFLTRDRLKIFADGASDDFQAHGWAWLCSMGLLGMAAAGTLSSCQALSEMPIKATFLMEEGALSYSSKGGLAVEYRPAHFERPTPNVQRGTSK